MKSLVLKHSIIIGGHKTSVSLESEFWSGLKNAADQRGITLSALVSEIDEHRTQGNLSSAIRLFVLENTRSPVVETSRDPSIQPGAFRGGSLRIG